MNSALGFLHLSLLPIKLGVQELNKYLQKKSGKKIFKVTFLNKAMKPISIRGKDGKQTKVSVTSALFNMVCSNPKHT